MPNMSSQISLQDVIKATPAEDEAETKVMRSVEQGESSSSDNLVQAQQQQSMASGIFDNVPDQTAQHFVRPTPRRSAGVRLKKNESLSVEDELAGYANLLHAEHVNGDTAISSTTTDTEREEPRDDPIKAVAKEDPNDFASTAARLVRKKLKKKKRADQGENEEHTMEEFKSFLAFRKQSLRDYLKAICLYSFLPFGGMAAILFYFLENPGGDGDQGTTSWWLLFIFVRQVLTLTLAKGLEALVIDFFAINTKICLNLIGPFFTLMLVQSKGWAFQGAAWAAFDYAMLYGSSKFARHWLFYQDFIGLFNEENSAGRVLEQASYRSLLVMVLVVAIADAMKRFFLGLWYGQGVYRRYGKDLAAVMRKALLIQKVAALVVSHDFLSKAQQVRVDHALLLQQQESKKDAAESSTVDPSKLLIDNTHTKYDNIYYTGTGELTPDQKMKIAELLGEWEEPITDERKTETASISAVVSFRAAISTLNHEFPFTTFFGPAGTREECVQSAQKLYLRLDEYDGDKDGALQFNFLAAVALMKDGTLNQKILKDLIEVFRPTRDGDITILDFVKSVDQVYTDLRMLEASILNANKMNAASQSIVDTVFYFALFCIAIGIMGVDPVVFFGGITTFVVGFAFMIGGATSKWFEGLLFILVRRPFDIGDRIAVSGVEDEVSSGGSAGWIVKDLNLYYTTVIFGTTLEEATYSNGSLASSRVINHNRSPKAVLNFLVRFGINTPKEKLHEFAEKVKQFVRDRPRQWLTFSAFRLNDVLPEQGYIEYKVILQHRESWQQIGALLNSKADVQLFAYELSKEMDMGYENPPMPIIMRDDGAVSATTESHGGADRPADQSTLRQRQVGLGTGNRTIASSGLGGSAADGDGGGDHT